MFQDGQGHPALKDPPPPKKNIKQAYKEITKPTWHQCGEIFFILGTFPFCCCCSFICIYTHIHMVCLHVCIYICMSKLYMYGCAWKCVWKLLLKLLLFSFLFSTLFWGQGAESLSEPGAFSDFD